MKGNRWKSTLSRAKKHAVQQATKDYDWETWQWKVIQILETDLEIPDGKAASVRDCDGKHVCMSCRKSFMSKAAWAVHAFKIHQRTTAARKAAQGTSCTACGREYHQHVRLVRHLTHSLSCRQQIEAENGLVAKQAAMGSAVEVQERHMKHQRPVIRQQGPRPQTKEQRDPERMPELLNRHETDFLELLYDALEQPWTDVQQLIENFRGSLRRTTMHLEDAAVLFSQWIVELTFEPDYDGDLRPFEAMITIVPQLSARWLSPSEDWYKGQQIEAPKGTPKERFAQLSAIMGSMSDRPEYPLESKEVVLLHLFSGRRRANDVQRHWENLCFKEGLGSAALSVDIIIEPTVGNLLNSGSMALFQNAIREGKVQAAIAGPPCETISTARNNVQYTPDGRRKGPRPIRSVREVQGLSKLSLRELRQIRTANALWAATFQLLAVSITHGMPFILEHPAPPTNEYDPTIWRLPFIKACLSTRWVRLLTVLQGYYGGLSPKPTGLLLAHCQPQAEAEMRRWRTTSQLPAPVKLGRNEKGGYNTAPLKEYPEGFCRALVHVLKQAVEAKSALPESDRRPTLEGFETLLLLKAELDEVGEGEKLGPDYNPEGFDEERKRCDAATR